MSCSYCSEYLVQVLSREDVDSASDGTMLPTVTMQSLTSHTASWFAGGDPIKATHGLLTTLNGQGCGVPHSPDIGVAIMRIHQEVNIDYQLPSNIYFICMLLLSRSRRVQYFKVFPSRVLFAVLTITVEVVMKKAAL